jgi:deazaflavin-dependent oxidoreductase (nitroreductase family)
MEAWLWRSFVWHTWLVRVTRGKIGGRFGRLRFLLLHHVGAKSGAPRTTPLLYHPLDDRSGYVIIGSKGGSATNPAWLYNLRAHPDVEIEIPGEERRRPVRAREVPEGDERERLWNLMVADWRFFDSYQKRTPRRIPVLLLEPR